MVEVLILKPYDFEISLYQVLYHNLKVVRQFVNTRICVFTHVASIYANLLEQKKAFAQEKSSTLTGLVWDTHGRRFSVLGHKYGRHDVM